MKNNYTIRSMTKEDIDGVLEVEHESFSVPWSRQLFLDEAENSHTVYFVCCDGKKITAELQFLGDYVLAIITS